MEQRRPRRCVGPQQPHPQVLRLLSTADVWPHQDDVRLHELKTGKFLRVCRNDEPFDGQEDHANAWFSKDPWHPIWETEDAAVIIDILHPWGPAPFLSEDARWGGIPAFGSDFERDELNAMVPVAFQRSMAPIVEGGDLLPVALSVSGVHFEVARDPDSVWLVSLETSEAVKLTVGQLVRLSGWKP